MILFLFMFQFQIFSSSYYTTLFNKRTNSSKDINFIKNQNITFVSKMSIVTRSMKTIGLQRNLKFTLGY